MTHQIGHSNREHSWDRHSFPSQCGAGFCSLDDQTNNNLGWVRTKGTALVCLEAYGERGRNYMAGTNNRDLLRV